MGSYWVPSGFLSGFLLGSYWVLEWVQVGSLGGGAGRCGGQVCGFLNACVVMLWRQWGLFCMHVVCSFAVVIAPMAPEGRQIGP